MKNNRMLGCMVLITTYLASCAAPFGPRAIQQNAGATSTVLLPGNQTTPPASESPQLFSTVTENIASRTTLAATRRVNLQAVGDMMFARTVGKQILEKGPGIVFGGVQSVFDSADVLVGNLECALTTSSIPQAKSYTFAAPPEAAQALAMAGFDVVSLANNHAMDFGSQGLADSLDNLRTAGIRGVGAGANATAAHAPVILERNGLRLAFLAYVDVPAEKEGFDARSWIATDMRPGIAWADPAQIAVDVSATKELADIVIVQLHSGYEISAYIPALSPNQRAAAHAAIDAGAALVLGSHSHVLQPIEEYHGGLIAYSLGNFVFDGYLGIVNATIILRVVLTPAGVESYDWVPVLIENGLPQLSINEDVPAIGTMIAPIKPVEAPTLTPTATFMAVCTPPRCAIGTTETYYCPGVCPAGCGTTCATYTPTP
jgi:poly-gamma-glutamate capsule biosynthesis protein CapA/YwtB (metallophosphatase superfamily)